MKPFLKIEDLSLAFSGVQALNGISLEIEKGSLLAVIGPNGAGKTSLFNCISGLYRPQTGHISFDRRDITRLSSHRIATLGVARMLQNLALFENLTVLENLLVGRHHLYRSQFWSNLLWLPGTRREEDSHRHHVEKIIDFLDLEHYRKTPAQILPYGIRKRVELGRALAMEPSLLLLDEPAAGLNQEETEDMARYILDIKEELRITQILIEHKLRFVFDLADQVMVLDFGKKIAEGTPDEVSIHPAVIEAYIGQSDDPDHSKTEAQNKPTIDNTTKTPTEGSNQIREVKKKEKRDSEPLDPGPIQFKDQKWLEKTLPGHLVLKAQKHPRRTAIRFKDFGLWKEVSWFGYLKTVRAVARKLWALGVRPGDYVSILSDNRPEWLYIDIGAQSIGAIGVGIYPTNPPNDVAFVLNDCKSVIIFCEDQEQVDKMIEITDQTPTVENVVVFEPRGTRHIDDQRLIQWADFLEDGFELAGSLETDQLEKDDWFLRRLARLDPEKPSIAVYTSGTTGNPKGAMISSRNIIELMRGTNQVMNMTEKDHVLSYLPLCHVAEKIFSVFQSLTVGTTVHFGESLFTVQTDLREVSPTVFLGVPRIWEKIHASLLIKMKDSSWLKRTLFNFFTQRGIKIAERRHNNHMTVFDRIIWSLGYLLVFRTLRERLGLLDCRLPASGAAPISPDLLSWFHGIGVKIIEGYGQTESAGISHLNTPGNTKVGTVGKCLPQVSCHIADDGEILVKGPNVFLGYINRPEDTAESLDEDGWLHTGDIGKVDENGFLTITGRKKEIIITSGGKNLSPAKIENTIKMSPYIKEAVAIGDARKFVSALIQIEFDTVGNWAIRQKIPFTSNKDLASKDEVVKLISQEVDQANKLLAQVEQIRAFRLIPYELDQDAGELTATQKVRRKTVLTRFDKMIESMY